VAVAAGAGQALGILEDGSMAAWGQNDAGQANVPSSAFNVLSLAAGDVHSLALLASGEVLAWGDNSDGQLNLPSVLQPVQYWTNSEWWEWVNLFPNPAQAIAARGDHSLALMTNGTVAAWGDNMFGESTVPANLTNAVAIAAGYLHSVALCADGTVTVWGDDTFGETNVPPGLSNVVAIAAGDFHTLALLSNGRVVGWGDDSFGQAVTPVGLAGAAGIACGYYHNLALVPASQLKERLTAGQIVLEWGAGILQWAPTPAGPYVDLPSQGGTYTNFDLSDPGEYFRLRY
jgi:alpha-tubulin suppressor-like RCC1 family protein